MVVGKTLLSRYKVIKQIGRGGFAYTYLAEDMALPDRPYCVVKRLSPQNPNEKTLSIAKKLFDREARSLYHLGEHDRVPRLYAHFCQDGQFYLVQEFIKGVELSEEIKTGTKLSEVEVIKLLREILEVLQTIHQENIIHRDIKPSNIIRREKDGKLVIIDFGIVKEFSGDINPRQPNTTKIGSSGYMAPEQSLGYPQLASDIYAVGVMAILALSGMKAEDIKKDPKGKELIWRDRVEASEKLTHVLSSMVRYDFQRRYQNASEALAALNLIIPPVADKKGNKFKKGAIAITSILGLIGIGITGIYLTKGHNYDTSMQELQNYLAAENWEEADRKTDSILIQAMGNELEIDAIEQNLSCEELGEIDRLWQEYSRSRFGFTVQKQIYLETDPELQKYSQESYENFRDRIQNTSLYDDGVPRGYYPTLTTIYPEQPSLHSFAHWILLDRTQTCGL